MSIVLISHVSVCHSFLLSQYFIIKKKKGGFVCLYFLCDVEVAGVDAVCEQILCAAALTGPKHTVVGVEQLTAEGEDTLFKSSAQTDNIVSLLL